MDLIRIMEMFPTQKDCIVYLERLRWQGLPECPQCGSNSVGRRNETTIGRNRIDGKRQEKSLKLSTITRFRIESENNLAHDDVYTR